MRSNRARRPEYIYNFTVKSVKQKEMDESIWYWLSVKKMTQAMPLLCCAMLCCDVLLMRYGLRKGVGGSGALAFIYPSNAPNGFDVSMKSQTSRVLVTRVQRHYYTLSIYLFLWYLCIRTYLTVTTRA